MIPLLLVPPEPPSKDIVNLDRLFNLHCSLFKVQADEVICDLLINTSVTQCIRDEWCGGVLSGVVRYMGIIRRFHAHILVHGHEAAKKYLFFQKNRTEYSLHMDAASTTLTSKIFARYLANIRRECSSYPFTHDRNFKPDRTCRYYLIGRCAFGTSCRYDHKRPPLDGIKAVKSLCTAENFNSTKAVENGCSSDKTATTAAAVNRSSHEFSVDAAEFVPSWKVSTLNEVNTVASGSFGSLPLCPYFETGECDKGDKCQFVHGDVCDLCNVPCLHPMDTEQRAQHRRECIDAHEAAMKEAFAEARSADKVCDCIRKWRRNQNDHFEKKTVRSCPECRTHSDFVIPATYWVEDQADKDDLIAKFRENAKQKQCKYVKEGYIDDCPFGNKCFYKHELPDGTVVEGDSPRTLHRRRRPLYSEVWSFSDSDSEDDFSRIAQGIISRSFSLV
ncbi:unnamed protein product [Cercopithifilaria johnstoni]|uniref:RING-type E3 ubiquitin transferase n=1 Tax=Cercopithifilaria johnstoni TaxID=2874296 RepID=A0A8J2PTK8_9BILA|nr:unnamed protein product [Cercopithifilaria johnstoni]